jgi:osmoprotectant transport system permease protein
MTGLLDLALARGPELRLLVAQHLVLVLAATTAAVAIGVPLGLLLTRRPGLARSVLGAAGVVQTIPSLALFGFLVPLPFIGGIGARTAIVALIVYALLPILRNTYDGVRQVDPAVAEAATAMGMTGGQRLRMVEIPLALPSILGGVRIAAVVSVGTATIAAAVGAGGLGAYVFRGLATLDTRLVLLGAIPAAALAVAVDALLARVERSRRPARAAVALAVTALVVLAAAAFAARPSASRRVVVVSKNFTEQVILGQIVAGALERAGLAVDRRLNLGGTALCHQALLAGEADVYVEYTGTALKDVLKEETRSDPHEALSVVRDRYRARGLFVGDPLGFDNTFALVMRRPDAEGLGLRRISDLAAHAARLRVGLFGEFLEREDGMPGLARAYGLRFGPPPREMDLGLLYQALLAGRVDLVVGSATDGLIAAHDLVVLEDDRRYFPPYDAVVVARAATLAREPVLERALRGLEGTIDAAAMRRMNLAVDGARRRPREVAAAFLDAGGVGSEDE